MEQPDEHELSAPVGEDLVLSWRDRYEREGAAPESDQFFASVETALVLDPWVAADLSHPLRRLRICLPVLGGGKEWGAFAVKGADLFGWGVWDPDSEFLKFSDWNGYLSGLTSHGLLEDRGRWTERDEFRDPREKRDETPRRMIRLLPVALETNRRRGAPEPRSNAALRSGIATFRAPARLFYQDTLIDLTPAEFILLMAVHALNDMPTFAGADPAHLRVEDGLLVVSDIVARCVTASAGAIHDAVVRLEKAGFIRLVPAAFQHIGLPSALPTVEVVEIGAPGNSFVFRPTAVWHKDAVEFRGAQPDKPAKAESLYVELESQWPLRLVVRMGDQVAQVPQYDPSAHRRVVSDRAVQSLKKRVARAIPDARLHRSEIRLGFADDERRLGLVHLAKTTIDAMRESKTITGDSKYVVERLDIRRESVRKDRGAHIDISVHELDEDVVFSRRLYVGALEWRPPARRGPASLSVSFPTYTSYIEALIVAVADVHVDDLVLGRIAGEPVELAVHVDAPAGHRFDPDNVALFGCDLLTLLLSRRDMASPVDRIVDRVLITHGEGTPSVTLEIRPLENSLK